MSHLISLTPLLADNGLVFALEHSTLPGKFVLGSLFFASTFSWTVMVTKMNTIARANKMTRFFLKRFRTARQPLRIYENRHRFDGTPTYAVYMAGCRELTFHLLGTHRNGRHIPRPPGGRRRISPAPRCAPSAPPWSARWASRPCEWRSR